MDLKKKKYDETHKARTIAKYINSEHTEVFVSKEDFFNNVEKIIEVKDVPLSIPHEYPLYLLSKKMKQDIKVVLSGETMSSLELCKSSKISNRFC